MPKITPSYIAGNIDVITWITLLQLYFRIYWLSVLFLKNRQNGDYCNTRLLIFNAVSFSYIYELICMLVGLTYLRNWRPTSVLTQSTRDRRHLTTQIDITPVSNWSNVRSETTHAIDIYSSTRRHVNIMIAQNGFSDTHNVLSGNIPSSIGLLGDNSGEPVLSIEL